MKKIQIAIPCYNEELTIGRVVDDFRRVGEELRRSWIENPPSPPLEKGGIEGPRTRGRSEDSKTKKGIGDSETKEGIRDFKIRGKIGDFEIVVIDNNSTDRTAQIARARGARVIFEGKQGKGHAVQKSFHQFDGDILVLVDGDATYSAGDLPKILEPLLLDQADMVVGNRIHVANQASFKVAHWWGNRVLTETLNFLFGTKLQDMESGFRAMSRRYVESSALLAGDFGIEPELTVQALEKNFRIKEVPITLSARPKGSQSKLNAIRDGIVVLYTVLSLFRDYKPLYFFTALATIFLLPGIVLGWQSYESYFVTHSLEQLPAMLTAVFLITLGVINFVSGLILSSIKRRHEETVVILGRIIDRLKK